MDALKWAIKALIESALNGFDKMVLEAKDVLTGGLFNTNNVWNDVLSFSNTTLKPFCLVIIGICLLIEIAQVAAKVDIIKWEHGLKLCVKMALAKVCIDTAPSFLRACYNQASIWISSATSMGGYTSLGTTMLSEVNNQIDNISGIFPVLGLLASCIVLIMAIKICGLLVEVIAFGRMFELYVYLAVSPLPCAFFPLGDGSGGGMSRITMKFFKSFIAVCLQGVMMIISIQIFNMIVGQALDSLVLAAAAGTDPTTVVSDMCYTMLLAGIVLVMSVAKCGSWAKGIIDAM